MADDSTKMIWLVAVFPNYATSYGSMYPDQAESAGVSRLLRTDPYEKTRDTSSQTAGVPRVKDDVVGPVTVPYSHAFETA